MSKINDLCTQLKLSYIRDNFETLSNEAIHSKQEYSVFLENLLVGEVERRTENRDRKIAARRHFGAFLPALWAKIMRNNEAH
jgi:hypothetical protein